MTASKLETTICLFKSLLERVKSRLLDKMA